MYMGMIFSTVLSEVPGLVVFLTALALARVTGKSGWLSKIGWMVASFTFLLVLFSAIYFLWVGSPFQDGGGIALMLPFLLGISALRTTLIATVIWVLSPFGKRGASNG